MFRTTYGLPVWVVVTSLGIEVFSTKKNALIYAASMPGAQVTRHVVRYQ